jgi:hypothetical protein
MPRPVKDLGRYVGPYVIPLCVAVSLRWTTTNGKVVRNILHGSISGGYANSTTIAQAVYAAIIASGAWTAWKPYVYSANALAGVDIRDMRVTTNPWMSSTGGSTAGTGAAAEVPAGVSLCVTLKTAKAGRGYRGRVYLPGLDTSAVTAATGAIVAAANTAAVNFIGAVQTAMAASGITLAIAEPPRNAYTSLITGVAVPQRAADVTPVTTIMTRSTTFRSQRRRALRV